MAESTQRNESSNRVSEHPAAKERLPAEGTPVDQATSPTPADSAAELRSKIESLENDLLRARADFQNLQRRASTERIEAIRFANADLIRALLGVVDDIERTLAAEERNAAPTAVGAGVRLAYENFMKVLRDNGVEPIEAGGQPFDPSIHNALLRQPSKDHPAGSVLQQVTKGFRLRDRVLRPATVIVSSGSDSKSETKVAEATS